MSSSSSSFRPIAPAMDVYSASCNPPRRAKRLRPDDDDDDIPDSVSSLSPDDDNDNDNDQPQHPPPKRRGRKPGTLSRAAREAQRKINHSLIEKARRTKINDALAALRELVPPEYKRDAEEEEELDPKKPKPKPKVSGEKEFKLEILVRTVAYLQDLTAKVRQLEHDRHSHCNEPIALPDAPAPKRQRDEPSSRDGSVSRLPSISTWLPEEQRSLLLTPSQSPPFDASARLTQLPTPPTSATCAPATSGFPIPPALTLPSPSTFLPPMQPRFSGFTTRANHMSSPAASPVYTPDDETAASLLLRISSAPKAAHPTEVRADKNGLSALTPSRLLGLSAER